MTDQDIDAAILHAADQIPTLTEALACVDCEHLFRTGDSCPFCASKSILNIADVLGTQNIYEKMQASRGTPVSPPLGIDNVDAPPKEPTS
mgnify:CR=1 FL=1